MHTLIDLCRANTAHLQAELRRQIQFIESGDRLNVSAGDIDRLRAQLAEHDALVEQYAHLH
jgi:hypothetical protein